MLDALKRFASEHILADDADAKPAASGPTTPAAPTTTISSTAAASNEFVTLLRQAIKARNTPYTSLLTAIDRLTMIPDMTVRTQAAFATIQGEGRGVREVLGAVDVHLQDLESQRMQFSQALDRQRAAAVGAAQAELDGVVPANDAAQRQIEQLTQQITALSQQIAERNGRAIELQAQITNETARFALQAQQFESALTVVKTELEGQKSVLAATLK